MDRSVVDQPVDRSISGTNGMPDVAGVALRKRRYKAFLSYSQTDRELATRLQLGLQQFAKPHRTSIRNINVFRDETNLGANPSLWRSITEALDDSEFLIYLASPEAAQSKWVQREIGYWLEHRGVEHILIVYLRGDVPWRTASAGLQRHPSLPDVLQVRLMGEPLFVDLQWASVPNADLSLKNPAFLDAVSKLAGPLHGKAPNELIGIEVDQQRRTVRFYRIVAALLASLTIMAISAWAVAAYQRNQANQRQILATGRQLVAQAELLRSGQPHLLETSTLLALEALKKFASLGMSSVETDQTLRSALRILPRSAFPSLVHKTRVTRVALLPSNGPVVTASADGSIVLWSALTGERVHAFAHAGAVNSVAYDPSGRYLLTGSDDGSACVWDIQAGSLHHQPFKHVQKVTAAIFSPDAALIGTSSWDGTAKVWSVATGVLMRTLEHRENGAATEVRGLAFSSDSSFIATFDPYAVRLWRAGDGSLVRVTRQKNIRAIAFSSGAPRLAIASGDGTVSVDEARTGKRVFTVRHDGEVTAVVFDRQGERLATTSVDGTARVWNASTGAPIARLAHGAEVWDAAFEPTGSYLATASSDRTARVWDLQSQKEVARVGHTTDVTAVAMSAERRVVSGDVGGVARVVEVAGGETLRRLQHGHEVQAIALTRDERYVTIVADDGAGAVWDLTTGTSTALDHGVVRSVTPVADAEGHVAMSWRSGLLHLWSIPARTSTSVQAQPLTALAFSPAEGDRRMAVSIDPNRVEMRVQGEARPKWVGTHDAQIEAIAFSSDGQRVASASTDGTTCVWRGTDGVRERCFPHAAAVTTLAFGSRGLLLTGDVKGGIEIHHLDGSDVRSTVRQDSEVTSVAVTPDGKHFAAGSSSGVVRIWTIEKPTEVARIEHQGRICCVRFIAVGRYVLTASADGSVRVSAWRPDDLAFDACQRLGRNLEPQEQSRYLGTETPETCDPRHFFGAYHAPMLRPILPLSPGG